MFSRVLRGHSQKIQAICFSSNGELLASAGDDKTIKVWRLKQKKSFSLEGHGESGLWCGVNSVAFHPNGKLLASGSHDKTVKLWSLENGQLLYSLRGHQDKVLSVKFSPNGNVLASSGDINDKTIKLWFLSQNTSLTLKGHSDWFGGVYSVAFSPDGQLIASGSNDKTIKIWQVSQGKELMTLTDHSGKITSVAISLDGKILASGSDDKTLKLWKLHTGEVISTIPHPESVETVAFSPDGTVATGCEDGIVRLFTVQPSLPSSLMALLNDC